MNTYDISLSRQTDGRIAFPFDADKLELTPTGHAQFLIQEGEKFRVVLVLHPDTYTKIQERR
jgi:hypothetical protein